MIQKKKKNKTNGTTERKALTIIQKTKMESKKGS